MASEGEIDTKLIHLVEQFPGLYDKSSADYKNPIAVAAMWDIISKKLKTSSNECQDRWKYLRKRFTQTGASTWQHYHNLLFLEPFIKRRKFSTNNSTDVKSLDEDVIILEEESNESRKSDNNPLKRKRKRKINKAEEHEAIPDQSFPEKNPEQDSIYSFCNSICNDLLKLPAQQILNCRIDILLVIQKYMLKMNNLNNSCNTDTLVPELMKHFARVENKITDQEMPIHDKDWVFLYCIKNLFSKMMELQKHNEELQDLLRGFLFKDSNDTRLERIFSQCSSNPNSYPSDSVQVESTVEDMKDEGAMPEANHTSFEPVYFEETELKEILPPAVATLKEQIISNGIINENFCNICDQQAFNSVNHVKNSYHNNAKKNYYLHCCIRNLNPCIFKFINNTLQCIPCMQNIYSLWYLNKHATNCSHMTKTKSIVENVDSEYSNYIRKGVLKVGTSFRFCLLCQKHICGIPHHREEQHKKKLMEVETFCKINNEMYCFICRKLFSVADFEQHKNEKDHRLTFRDYYFNFRKPNKF